MNAIGAKQQNRSERAATVVLDNEAQGIQDLVERNTSRHHLKKALFTGEQRFSSLAFADIYRCTDITLDFARRVEDGSPHALDMLNKSVGKRDSKFQIKT